METASGNPAPGGNQAPPAPTPLSNEESEYFDPNVLKGAVSFSTKPFKHRALMGVGLWKALLFPFYPGWWLARISRWRFFAGCTFYVLHNACAWLYIRRCLPLCEPAAVLAGRTGIVSVTQMEILLPYIIGVLFSVGYGSVVAAGGGWEASRVPIPVIGAGSAGGCGGQDANGNGGTGIEGDELESSASGSDNDEHEDGIDGRGAGEGGDIGSRQRGGPHLDASMSTVRSNDAREGQGRGFSDGRTHRGDAEQQSGGSTDDSPASSPRVTFQCRAPGGEADANGQPIIPMLHQTSSFDASVADVDEEEDEEEDCGGWGQVVVKPVKVAQWNKNERKWEKKSMSLPELRQRILYRAGNTPQNITYLRAARLGAIVTSLLPTFFAMCAIVTAAWADSGDSSGNDQNREEIGSGDPVEEKPDYPWRGMPPKVEGGWCDASNVPAGTMELEGWILQAMARALKAVGTLIVHDSLRGEVDGMAVAIAVVSTCSVAFLAWPIYAALVETEQIYQRRYMYSKYFCALTSSQRARKHNLPHFSLKNVANIRVWLALRAGKTWLRRHRRERSADAVVSMAFFLCIALIAAIISEVVSREARFLTTLVHWELLVWCCFTSFFLLRYLTLGSNTNNRYRDTGVLLTEQINVQLRILQNSTRAGESKASKRERLVVSSNVLKLATKLLKELDGPNKLSGLSMNPVLYNVTRVVLVSALSGVMSDTLGFNIKLWKILSFK